MEDKIVVSKMRETEHCMYLSSKTIASVIESNFSISSNCAMDRNRLTEIKRIPPEVDQCLTMLRREYFSALDTLKTGSFVIIPFVHLSNSFSQFAIVLTGTTNKTLWIFPRPVVESNNDGCTITAYKSDTQDSDLPLLYKRDRKCESDYFISKTVW